MAWVRIDDGFPEHPKIDQAGHLAGWLFVCALAHANRNLTDGFVSDGVLPRLSTVPAPGKRAAELVAVGLFDPVPGGWQIHDYHEFQPSREQVLERRRKDAARQARHRSRNEGSHGVTPVVSHGPVTPAPVPYPKPTVEQLLTSSPVGRRDGPVYNPPVVADFTANADAARRVRDDYRSGRLTVVEPRGERGTA